MITKHQVERALGNIRLLGPDIPTFDKDVSLVYEYITQAETVLREASGVVGDVIWLDNNLHNYGSPEWRDFFKAALRDARRSQVAIAEHLANQPDTVVPSSGAKEA